MKSGVTTIKEEADQTPDQTGQGKHQPRQSTSLRQRSSGSSRGLAAGAGQRGGSVGRHPSGQHSNLGHPSPNAGLAPIRQSQSANVSLVANSGLPRPEMTTDFIAWSAKFFNKQLMKNEYVNESGGNGDCFDHESNRSSYSLALLFLNLPLDGSYPKVIYS